MKFAFSTLGCPSWDYNEIVSTALDLGYDGLEIRGISSELYAPKIKAFSNDNIKKSLDSLKGLELPMLTTNAVIAVPSALEQTMQETIDYINLAAKIGTKYIRLLCTNTAGLDGGDYELAKKTYRNICAIAEDYNVTPLIETNGMFCDSSLLAKFMREVDHVNSGVLWDIHHPYRFNNECIDSTINNIGNLIKYVHIKDSKMENNKVVYKMLGYGDIPLKLALDSLKTIGFDGYVTLEWVKRWNPDLEEPGIVFAHFISSIKNYL